MDACGLDLPVLKETDIGNDGLVDRDLCEQPLLEDGLQPAMTGASAPVGRSGEAVLRSGIIGNTEVPNFCLEFVVIVADLRSPP